MVNSSVRYGLVKRQYVIDDSVSNSFNNALVTEDTGLTIKHNAILCIDSDGYFIVTSEQTQISIPDTETWYWVKIYHSYSSKESGLFSIDTSGNLVGDSEASLLEILRGQPNFPSKVKFLNASLNTNEYTVLEVIDSQNAILDGSFSNESDLELSVVGTFTPGAVPITSEKNIFQYDSYTIELIEETSENEQPTKIDGKEFFIARVGIFSGSVLIQDKRTEFFELLPSFDIKNVEKQSNPCIGVESIKYSHTYSDRSYNQIIVSWGFKSTNWTVSTNLNIITLNGGQGGKFKTTNDFTDGDFNGWRLYTKDGSYSTILVSTRTGSQINLTLDILDVDKFSDDGGDTFVMNEIIITPNAEEIEIVFESAEELIDSSGSSSNSSTIENGLPDKAFVFPINTSYGLCPVLAYNEDYSYYRVKYRYKHIDNYSESFKTIPDDLYGYFTESAYDFNGNILNIVVTNLYAQNISAGYIKTQSSGIIELKISSRALKIVLDNLDLGDLNGVEVYPITSTTPSLINLVVGSNKKWIRFTTNSTDSVISKGSSLTLTKDIYINLDELRADGTATVNGNVFTLQFLRLFTFNGFTIKIVQDYNETGPTYTLLKEITWNENEFTKHSEMGLVYDFIYNGESWKYRSDNDILDIQQSTYNFVEEADVDTSVATYQPFRVWYDPLSNRVWMKGALQRTDIKVGTATWGTIAEEYRPTQTVTFLVTAIDGASAREHRHITIASTGVLSLLAASDANEILFFDGLSYYLD